MGGCQTSADHVVRVRDYASDDVSLITQYAERHKAYVSSLDSVQGLEKHFLLSVFNDSYELGKGIFDKNGKIPTYGEALGKPYPYEEFSYMHRVLQLCLMTDICQKLGLSLADFMHLDLATFDFIERTFKERQPKEDAIVQSLLQETKRPK